MTEQSMADYEEYFDGGPAPTGAEDGEDIAGLSEKDRKIMARIVRENVLELDTEHIHSYVEATTFAYDLQMCIVKLRCSFPFRWRWNSFFDWTYCEKDPRLYEVNPKLAQRGLAVYGGLSSSAICPLSEALADGLEKAWVCRAVLDERTCETCDFFDGTDAVPPHDDCTSENGCRCHLYREEKL